MSGGGINPTGGAEKVLRRVQKMVLERYEKIGLGNLRFSLNSVADSEKN